MASPLKNTGIATIFGFSGTVTPTGVAGVASFYKKSGDFSTEYKRDVISNDQNDPKGLVYSGGLVKGSLSWTPAGANNAAVAAACEEPAIGSAVTLASFKIASLNHARWVYDGNWKVAFVNDGIATYSFDIVCAKDSATDLSATVS